jgi:hypothetical protein
MFKKRTINSGTYFQGPTDTRDPFVPIPKVRDDLFRAWGDGGIAYFYIPYY